MRLLHVRRLLLLLPLVLLACSDEDEGEANRAAEEDGVIEPGEGVPNDYDVRNVNERLRTLPVAADATASVVRLPDCCENMDLDSVDAWVAWYQDPEHRVGLGGPDGYWWLTVRSGVVIGIEEQYRP